MSGFKERPNCPPAKRLPQSMPVLIAHPPTNKINWFGFLRQWTMVDEPCSCLRGGWQGCCSRRTLSALSCRDQGTQEDCPPFESAVRHSSGGRQSIRTLLIPHNSRKLFFFLQIKYYCEVRPLPLKLVPWYHRGPRNNRQSCPPDWCQRCPVRQAWVRLISDLVIVAVTTGHRI